MNYSLDKYKFYEYNDAQGKKTVSAVSTYAGRTVKGYAKCDPKDSFDSNKGKKLAAARCNQKVSRKRLNRAAKKYMEAARAADEAAAFFDKMKSYYMDSVDALDQATMEVNSLLENM